MRGGEGDVNQGQKVEMESKRGKESKEINPQNSELLCEDAEVLVKSYYTSGIL